MVFCSLKYFPVVSLFKYSVLLCVINPAMRNCFRCKYCLQNVFIGYLKIKCCILYTYLMSNKTVEKLQ